MDDKSSASVWSVMCLVAGTCIGGGMLALPVATGVGGFFPSLVLVMICWLFMTLSALLLLEASLWMEPGAHVITISSRLLGKPGRIVAWLLYLFIGYASIIAYTAGGGLQVVEGMEKVSGALLSRGVGCTAFLLVFGAVVSLGSLIVGRVNAILFVAMVVAYFALVGVGIDQVKLRNFSQRSWGFSWLAVPLFLTSFSFQTIVPSLTPMLRHNAKKLRLAIVGGTTMSLLIYIVWEYMVLGIIPVEGSDGLAAALRDGVPATNYLRHHVSPVVAYIAEYFAFFALVTSFLGIALGLFDFLSDGLNVKKTIKGRIFLSLLIGIPTLVIPVYFERAFLVALEATGGYGDSILNGLMPVMFVWVGRYHKKFPQILGLPGGKPLLIGIFLFFLCSLLLEVCVHMGIAEGLLGIHVDTTVKELIDFTGEGI